MICENESGGGVLSALTEWWESLVCANHSHSPYLTQLLLVLRLSLQHGVSPAESFSPACHEASVAQVSSSPISPTNEISCLDIVQKHNGS